MDKQQSLNEAIISEVRTELGRRNIKHADFARSCGWGKQYFHRRMTGQVPWSTDELEIIAKMLSLPGRPADHGGAAMIPLSLKCRLYGQTDHAPCSGTTDDGTERNCECWCHSGSPLQRTAVRQ